MHVDWKADVANSVLGNVVLLATGVGVVVDLIVFDAAHGETSCEAKWTFLRAAARRGLRRRMEGGGTSPFPVMEGAPATPFPFMLPAGRVEGGRASPFSVMEGACASPFSVMEGGGASPFSVLEGSGMSGLRNRRFLR